MDTGTITAISTYLKEKGYKIETEDENTYLIRYQTSLVRITIDESLDNYCSIDIPIPVDDGEEEESLIQICHDITKNERSTKAYRLGEFLIIAYEFFFTDQYSLLANMEIGLESVVVARGKLRTAQIINQAIANRELI